MNFKDAAKIAIEAAWDGYRTHPAGTTVTRTVGPLHMGLVTEPTMADVDRCYSVHGVASARDPMVLVQWGVGQRSWEYTQDLRIIPANNNPQPRDIQAEKP